MVILFFAVSKGGKYTFSTREFAEYLKKSVLNAVEQKKVVPLELSIMKDLVTNSLDSLLQLNDDLLNHDGEIEGFLRNLEKTIFELEPTTELQVNVKGTSQKIEDGISQFSWDESRYPKNQKKIEDILAKINEKFTSTRTNLKSKQDEYNSEKEKLNLKKKSQGEALGLMKTDYRVIVEKCQKGSIQRTDYLRTVLCFVPKQQKENFLKNYQNYGDGMVVPNSALQLDVGEDEKMFLYRIVIMEHAIESFKNQLNSQLRIQSREYSEEEIKKKPSDEREIEHLNASLKDKKAQLIRNSTAGYSEIYYALLHLKFLRLYVECSLKYGNSDYYSTIIFISPGKEQKVVSTLIKVFNDTNDQGWYGTKEDLKDTEDFYPFILIKLGVPSSI